MDSHPAERERPHLPRPTLTKWSYFLTASGVVCYGVARGLAKQDSVALAPKVALAAAAATLLGLAFWRIERELLKSTDEMEQRVRLESALLALPVTAGLLAFLGLLHRGGTIVLRPEAWFFFVVCVYLLALSLVRRRYS